MAAPITENTRNPRMIQSAMLMIQDEAQRSERTRGLNLQLASCQLTIRLEVLFAAAPCNFLGEGGRGRLLVPANFFEVVPYILLVVRILRLARLIGVGRPEARGIRCEHF